MCCAVLQVGRDYRDFLGIISSIVLNKNICYDPLLVPSQQDGSNEGLKYTFSLRNTRKKKISWKYPTYLFIEKYS